MLVVSLQFHPHGSKPLPITTSPHGLASQQTWYASISQKSTATVQGHLHRERQNLQSTRPQIKQEDTPTASITQQQEQVPTEDLLDFFPESPSPNIKTNEVVYAIVDKTRYTLGYQDLTGRFPVRSSQGNEYILGGYCCKY